MISELRGPELSFPIVSSLSLKTFKNKIVMVLASKLTTSFPTSPRGPRAFLSARAGLWVCQGLGFLSGKVERQQAWLESASHTSWVLSRKTHARGPT